MKIPIRVMRSAALLSLWEKLETANQDHILKILDCAGVPEHKFKQAVERVGGPIDKSPNHKKGGKAKYGARDWGKR